VANGCVAAFAFVVAEIMLVYVCFAYASENEWLVLEFVINAVWFGLSFAVSRKRRVLGFVMGIAGLIGGVFPYFLGVAGFGGL
jgi:hypothetical protein